MIRIASFILISIILGLNGCRDKKPKNITVAFDIPHLIGKDIDEIREILGKPRENEIDPIDTSKKAWENTFKNNGNILIIDFDPKSRAINNLFIAPFEDNWSKTDVMKLGNLDSNDARYWIERGSEFNMEGDYSTLKVHPSN